MQLTTSPPPATTKGFEGILIEFNGFEKETERIKGGWRRRQEGGGRKIGVAPGPRSMATKGFEGILTEFN